MHDKVILSSRISARMLAGVPLLPPCPRRDTVCLGRYDPYAQRRPFALISVELSAVELPKDWRDG